MSSPHGQEALCFYTFYFVYYFLSENKSTSKVRRILRTEIDFQIVLKVI